MHRLTALALILALVLAVPALSGCRPPEATARGDVLTLAGRVPADSEQVIFLDLKPSGETGRRWAALRSRLEASPAGQQLLDGALMQFSLDEWGLAELASGPAVAGQRQPASFVILEVSDELDAMEALFDYRGLEWEQEPFGETTLYNSHVHGSSDQHRLAWMLDGNLLLLCQTYGDDPLPALKTLAGLQRSDSLAELPVWQTLVGRLPARSLGVFFVNAAVGFGGSTPPADDSSLAGQLAYQMEGVAMAATPGEQAMRLDIVGVARPQDDASARVRNLMSQEPLDLAVWDHLPAGTALALAGRDAPLIWPLADAFGLSSNSLAALRDTLGLDVEADLMAPGGVLSGEYAFAVTPPLPEQPVSQGVAALQVLIAATGAAAQQADPLRAAMEARGAAFGPGEAEGVPLQVQAGTALSGYALAYGEHDGTLLLGTSPVVVGQGIAAARDRAGLPHTDHFWTIRAGWSLGPTLALYIDHERLAALMQSNSASGQAVGLNDALLQAFHTTGLVLRLQPDRVDGTLYFLLE